MDNYNVFEHMAGNNPPEENTNWIKARVPGERPKSWPEGEDLHIWPDSESNRHTLSTKCVCDPSFEIERAIDGSFVDRAVLHRNRDGKTIEV